MRAPRHAHTPDTNMREEREAYTNMVGGRHTCTNTEIQATGRENIYSTYTSQKSYSSILKFQNLQLKTASEMGDQVEETQKGWVSDKHTERCSLSFI